MKPAEAEDATTRIAPVGQDAGSGDTSEALHAATPPRAGSDEASPEVTRVTPARAARNQNAGEWELDSITRNEKATRGGLASPSKSAASGTTMSASSASESSMPIFARGSRRTRKARLRLDRLDPWSVMKTAFLFSIAFGIMGVASVAVLWSVFAGSDTMTYINDFVNGLMAQEPGATMFDIREYLGWERVIGLTAVLTAINVVIFTAVATLFAFLYNLAAVIMGGLEVTLAED